MAAVKMLPSKVQFQGNNANAPKSVSINIAGAQGSFPYTNYLNDEGSQVDAGGMQVNAGLPSYILQA